MLAGASASRVGGRRSGPATINPYRRRRLRGRGSGVRGYRQRRLYRLRLRVCDDLRITVDAGRVTRAEGACFVSEPWLPGQDTRRPPVAEVEGRPTPPPLALKGARTPFPLRAFLHSDYPSDAEVLTRIGERMTGRGQVPLVPVAQASRL